MQHAAWPMLLLLLICAVLLLPATPLLLNPTRSVWSSTGPSQSPWRCGGNQQRGGPLSVSMVVPLHGMGRLLHRSRRKSRALSTQLQAEAVVGRASYGRSSEEHKIFRQRGALETWRSFTKRLKTTMKNPEKKGEVGKKEWGYMGRIAGAEKALLAFSVVMLIAAAVCEVAVPHFTSRCLNAVAFSHDMVAFRKYFKGMVLYSGLAAVFTGLRGAAFWLAGNIVVAKVRYDLFSALLDKDISFFDESETGQLTSRLSSDTTKISNVVSFHVNIILRQAIQAIGGIAYLFHLNRELAAVTVTGMVGVGVITNYYGLFSRRISKAVQGVLAEAGGVAEQSLSLVRVVRAHATEKLERKRYADKIKDTLTLQEAQGVAYGVARVVLGWLNAAVIASVLLLGSRMVFSGAINGEQLTSFLFYVNFVSGASFDVGDQWAKIEEALGGGAKVFELMEKQGKHLTVAPRTDIEAETDAGSDESSSHSPQQQLLDRAGTGAAAAAAAAAAAGAAGGPGIKERKPTRGGTRGTLVLKDCYFSYPSRPGLLVLKGLNLRVKQGEKVALIGVSGGGKSTVMRLISRFYELDQGSVTLDGREINTYSVEELSHRVAWVSQEPQLFPLSIRDNIAYGLPKGSYTEDDVIEAAVAANAHGFTISQPQGYNTLVGEGGTTLSGGQRQRLAIARALIRDPELLLLDEATSALDVESEAVVQAALEKASEGRTTLFIAHRLSTIENADRVVVLKDGRAVEDGPPSVLLRKGGLFAELYRQSTKRAVVG